MSWNKYFGNLEFIHRIEINQQLRNAIHKSCMNKHKNHTRVSVQI